MGEIFTHPTNRHKKVFWRKIITMWCKISIFWEYEKAWLHLVTRNVGRNVALPMHVNALVWTEKPICMFCRECIHVELWHNNKWNWYELTDGRYHRKQCIFHEMFSEVVRMWWSTLPEYFTYTLSISKRNHNSMTFPVHIKNTLHCKFLWKKGLTSSSSHVCKFSKNISSSRNWVSFKNIFKTFSKIKRGNY